MRVARVGAIAAVGGMLAACGPTPPHTFGQYNSLSPKVTAPKGERLPSHVTIALGRPANVAVFLVVPGRGSTLLFPADSTESGYMEAGTRTVGTSLAGLAADTGRAVRPTRGRPTGGVTRGAEGRNERGGFGRDTLPSFGFNQHGFLLVFASQQPMLYQTLANRVAGISIPIDDDDALHTVTMLIRDRNQIVGPWAAYATDYPP